jgi:hypothetical protein
LRAHPSEKSRYSSRCRHDRQHVARVEDGAWPVASQREREQQEVVDRERRPRVRPEAPGETDRSIREQLVVVLHRVWKGAVGVEGHAELAAHGVAVAERVDQLGHEPPDAKGLTFQRRALDADRDALVDHPVAARQRVTDPGQHRSGATAITTDHDLGQLAGDEHHDPRDQRDPDRERGVLAVEPNGVARVVAGQQRRSQRGGRRRHRVAQGRAARKGHADAGGLRAGGEVGILEVQEVRLVEQSDALEHGAVHRHGTTDRIRIARAVGRIVMVERQREPSAAAGPHDVARFAHR